MLGDLKLSNGCINFGSITMIPDVEILEESIMEKKFIVSYVDSVTKDIVKRDIYFRDIFGADDISKISKYGIILVTAIFEKNGQEIERKAFFRSGLSSTLMYYIMISSENNLWIEFNEKFKINLRKYSNLIFMDEMSSGWDVDDENELVNYYRETLPVFEYKRNFADVLAILVSYSDHWDNLQYCLKCDDIEDTEIKISKSYFKKQSDNLYTITTCYTNENYEGNVTAVVQDCMAIKMLFENCGSGDIIIDNHEIGIVNEQAWPDTISQGQNLLTVLILTMFLANGAVWWK